MPRTLLTLLSLALLAATAATSRAQWQLQDAHTTADLRGIDNVGHGVAWASGSDGTILRTEDAGFVWQLCAKPPNGEHLDFRAIQGFDNNTAIIMSAGKGDLSRLYKTTDGCQTWHLLFTNPDQDGFWDALKFQTSPENRVAHPLAQPKDGVSRVVAREADHNFGVLLGDPVDGRFVLFATLDGGLHWTRADSKDLAAPPQAAVFAASNSSLITRPSFITGGPNGAYFYGGDSVCTGLTAQTNPTACFKHDSLRFERTRVPLSDDSPSAGGFSLAFSTTGLDGWTLVAIGGDYSKAAERKGTAAYFDYYFGGWFAAKTPPGGFRSAVAYDPTTKTWITVGPNGTDISTDDGRNWRALHPDPKFNDPPDADQHWNALSLPYAVGPHGRIATLRPSALK